jgi:hypothetical protein
MDYSETTDILKHLERCLRLSEDIASTLPTNPQMERVVKSIRSMYFTVKVNEYLSSLEDQLDGGLEDYEQ